MFLPKLSAYPGEICKVSIKAYDELERPTATVLRLSGRDVSGDNNSMYHKLIDTFMMFEMCHLYCIGTKAALKAGLFPLLYT